MKSDSCSDRVWQQLRKRQERQITTLYKYATLHPKPNVTPLRRQQQIVGKCITKINRWLATTGRECRIRPGFHRGTYRLFDI